METKIVACYVPYLKWPCFFVKIMKKDGSSRPIVDKMSVFKYFHKIAKKEYRYIYPGLEILRNAKLELAKTGCCASFESQIHDVSYTIVYCAVIKINFSSL